MDKSRIYKVRKNKEMDCKDNDSFSLDTSFENNITKQSSSCSGIKNIKMYVASHDSSQKIKQGLKQAKILLIEDDAMTQMIHKNFLETLRCRVDTVKNGYMALRQYNKSYDLIFLDLSLPDIDGVSICDAIRQADLDFTIPIIALTAYGEHFRDECIAVGMNDVVAKPVSLQKFNDLLALWLVDYNGIELN